MAGEVVQVFSGLLLFVEPDVLVLHVEEEGDSGGLEDDASFLFILPCFRGADLASFGRGDDIRLGY